MKRLTALAIIVFTIFSAHAQLFKGADKETQKIEAGAIPVKNGKVTFEETIPAEGYTAEEVKRAVDAWVKERFVKPTVISVKQFESDQPETIILKGEEYIVFKNKFLVLERARIYYYLTLTANDGSCTFNMSRITYWYDDEAENGGIKNMKAEEWITDDMAFDKKGKLKKFEGKFRRKTIDLKNQLIEELEKELNSK